MSDAQFDDPNRESVGLDPIWTETGDNVTDPPPEEDDVEDDDS